VVQVTGLAEAAADVTVNSAPAYERGEYFWKEVSVSNGSNPVWQSISIQATNGASSTTTSGNLFVPRTPELYDDPVTSTVNEGYDADGNQIRDGRWNYVWDAENRLIRMVSATAVGPQQRLDFEYDGQSRRIRKKVWNNTAGTNSPVTDLKFLYDGWNLIAELDGNSAIVRNYIFGLDSSSTMQGAGGIGGLLAVKTSAGVCHFSACDANGNVAILVDGSSGQVSANYEYGPFGEPLRVTGVQSTSNACRYATKYTDTESGMLYYEYRVYNPSSGRWLSRDPIGENGGANLYAMVRNTPIEDIDLYGLQSFKDLMKSHAAKGSFEWEVRWPLGPGSVVGVFKVEGVMSECCGHMYMSASAGMELFYQIGYSKHPKGYNPPSNYLSKGNKNVRVPHPCNIGETVKMKDWDRAVESCKQKPLRSKAPKGGAEDSTQCPQDRCGGEGKIFIRGTIGVGVGVEATGSYDLTSGSDPYLSLSRIQGSLTTGWVGVGASIDVGGAGAFSCVWKIR
jgi:RHS repeat-associated protein